MAKMKGQKTFKLLLKSNIFLIPSRFPFLNDVNPDIYNQLMSNGQYQVKSDVSEEVFQVFLDLWVYNKSQNINLSVYLNMLPLCQEFQRMNNICQLFSKFSPQFSLLIKKLQDLRRQKKELDQKIYKKVQAYQVNNYTIFHNNGISSKQEFLSIKKYLYEACINLDTKKAYLLVSKKIEQDGLLYVLIKQGNLAQVIKNTTATGDIFIPKSVKWNSQEFTITTIFCNAFENSKSVNSIQFSEDSQLVAIQSNAFLNSSIERISIPSSVIQIENGAFSECRFIENFEFKKNSKLEKIDIDTFVNSSVKSLTIPSNITDFKQSFFNRIQNLTEIKIFDNKKTNITYFDNSLILGKSTEDASPYFDLLIFARRDIKNATIPSFVCSILPEAFSNCKTIEKVNFSKDSSLQIINSLSFYESSLSEICVPAHVRVIGSKAFFGCKNLKSVTFSESSEIVTIEEFAFSESGIEKITIPSTVSTIREFSFYKCINLNKVVFEGQSSFELIKESTFAFTSIEEITIPNKVIKIDLNAFENCEKLQKVLFTENSILEQIDEFAFKESGLISISIPDTVSQILPYAFDMCEKLNKIEFSENSQLKMIGCGAFRGTALVNILIPSQVVIVNKEAFKNCKSLEKVEFDKNSKLEIICSSAFYNSSIKSLSIPSSVEVLEQRWIEATNNLTQISVFDNGIDNIKETSDSMILGKTDFDVDDFDCVLFAPKDITTVEIPSNIVQIASDSFCNCTKLEEVTFSEDSKLETIQMFAFLNTNLKKIHIPPSVVEIGDGAFFECKQLSEVTFSENSKLESIGFRVFTCTNLVKLTLPSGIEIFEEGWACNLPYLTDISVVPSYQKNIIYDNHLVIKKSSPDQDNYDSILLISKDIKRITIPSFIKIIDNYSFAESSIEKVEFLEDSQLLIIKKLAFAYSLLNGIELPSSVVEIGSFAFSDSMIKSIDFKDDSNLKIIGSNAFISSTLRSISLPPSLNSIGTDAFSDCNYLSIIEIPENSQLDQISREMFDDSNPIIMVPVDLLDLIFFESEYDIE